MTTTLNMVKTGKWYDKIIGVRHVQCILCFFCLSLAYAWRVNLTVALVAMSERSNQTGLDEDVIEGNYNFTESEKSYMQSSFFFGYIVTQIPGGYIAQRYGAKTLLMMGLTACAILTLLSPLSLKVGGWQGLGAVRFLAGLTQGAVHPATHSLLSKWAPANERGMMSTICYSGSQFGTIVTLATSGYIAHSFTSWPGIFYCGGACGFLWVLFWWRFASSTPETHRSITREELKYIEETRSVGKMQDARKMAPTPWGSIFTSMPFLSLLIVHCTHMWGFWTLLTQIPSYMRNIYEFNIESSALLSSLPYAVMMILSFFFVWLSKVLQNQKSLSLSFNRKFFNSVGHWIPMLSLIALGYVPRENEHLAVALLTLTVGISAATYLGFQVNHIDLSPNYAGTMMGLTNAAANVMSALAPLAVGHIVKDPKNVNEWRTVFFLAAFFYFIGNLLFVVFGRTDVQWWDSPEPVDEESVEAGVPLAPDQQNGQKIIAKS
ncbi:putative inorganic phosphate cotransporter [Drosophila grimshawi]|uniref:Putative inorganic phosphate cotransporter n=1 Tax=Drosophila grimshawi TaxID=7222 RepID=B4JA20_DROGR|nr:putative inorganic phosphate cotransporter [Drosophila grimshawi]EDW02607.1 GH19798 [Drosophila grimshawi]